MTEINNSKFAVGICMGASSVSYVKAEKTYDGRIIIQEFEAISHNGDPKKVLIEKLKNFNISVTPTVVTGRKFRHLVDLTKITEPEAVEIAFAYHNKSGE
nr:hypothetical protein [Candidatus Kapabacteria bacterium]